MESLTNRLRSLELNLDQVVAHAGLAHAESLTNRSLCKVDADMAVVSERAYCYPVRCSLEQADSDLLIHFYKRAAAIREANVGDAATAWLGIILVLSLLLLAGIRQTHKNLPLRARQTKLRAPI